jgi:Abortive infection C-terminus
MSEELLLKVESLKNMFVSQATGGACDPVEYKNLRQELVSNSGVAAKLPRFVRTCRTPTEFWGFIKPKFGTYHERREYIREQFDDLLSTLEIDSCSPSDASISATVKAVSSVFVQEAWQKALERRATDPEGAITASRTLLESVCKHILDAAGVTYAEGADLPKLYSSTSKQLNLSPSQHTEDIFRQILGGCHAVVEGLGALRNRHSDAHGKGAAATKPSARHAELAVNLSGAMATFLLQTWESRKKD